MIMVERLKEPTPTKRQARLRDGGDGLQVDNTRTRCENTVQGANLVTDSMGTFSCLFSSSLFSFDSNSSGSDDQSYVRIRMYASAARLSAPWVLQ